ncbi:alpha/beta hydrolase [Kribbella sp. NPDC055071]
MEAVDEPADEARARRRRVGSVVWFVGTAVALVLALLVVLVDLGAAVPVGLLGAAAALIVPTLGPLLVIAALPALVIGLWRIRRGLTWTAAAASGLGALGTLTSAVLVVVMVAAIGDAGGSVNVFRALAPSSMAAASADVHEVYTVAGGQALSVAVYKPSPTPQPAPTLVYVHGGGWISGTEDNMPVDMRWFADHGWLVVSVQYRLANNTEHTWDQAPADVACAWAWTAHNAARLGGDPARLAILGESAGGNLALNLAYGISAGRVNSPCGTVPVPRAVVAEYPAVDPAAVYANHFSLGSLSDEDMVRKYLGGSPQEYPERVAATSSATYITAKAPQTLVIQGERDNLVPPDSVYDFVDKARAAGVDITLAKVPFANHSYDQLAANSIGNQAFLTMSQNYLLARVRS